MSRAVTATDSELLAAPLRSEAFAEDLFDETLPVAPPWTFGQAALAALLCAVPAVLAALGGAVSLMA